MTDSHKLLATLAAAGCIGVIGFMLMKEYTPSSAPAMQSDTVALMPLESTATTTKGILHQINSKVELDVLLAKTDKPVVIKFSTTWCPPCKILKPIYKSVATDRADRAHFAEIDVDAFVDKNHLDTFSVQSLPTIIVFKEGKQAKRLVGGLSKQALVQEFENAGV